MRSDYKPMFKPEQTYEHLFDKVSEENEKLKKLIYIITENNILSNNNQMETINELNQRIDIAILYIDMTIEIIKQQPTGNDEWILDRLNYFLSILKGDK